MEHIYFNPGGDDFAAARKSRYFIDKSDLIRYTNSVLGTEDRRILVSCPRRFGKTMALSILEACYSRGADSRGLFHGLSIEGSPSFAEHLNRHNVISLDIQLLYLLAKSHGCLDQFSSFVSRTVTEELAECYPDEVRGHEDSLADCLPAIFRKHGTKFIFFLDE